MKQRLTLVRASLAALAATSAMAGSFTSDFSNPAQAGITLVGGTRANGDPYPAIANGVLALTYAEGSLNGSAFLDELDPGQSVGSFTLNFNLRIGGGTSDPADGIAIYFGPEALSSPFGEEGPDNVAGLTISFDTFDNGGGEAPAIDVKWAGVTVGHVPFTAGNIQSDTFSPVSITLNANGTLDLSYKGKVVYSKLLIPGYTPGPGRFSFGARTGGSYSNHWIDDLSITTTVAGAPSIATVATPPASQAVNEHGSVTFSALPGGTPPFTIQWKKDGSPITDATNTTYSITDVSAGLNGAKYTVTFANALGSATSADAVLTVNADKVAPTIASAAASETFTTVDVTFSEPVSAATAGNKANYSLSGGLSVSSATVTGANTVRLTTSKQTPGSRYTLTVNGVSDTAFTPNVIAANSTKDFGAWVLAKGFLKFEAWYNIPNTPVQGLYDDPRYQAGTPDFVGYVSPFTSRSIFPDDSHENYGARISGFFTPAESGDYRFFDRSDDASQLFLSANADPAGLVQIAEETGCCNGFLEPDAPQTSGPITLVGGTPYFIQQIYKEGGGGDYGEVAVRKEGASTPLVPIQGRFLSTYANPDTAVLAITTQPVSKTGAENTTVTFTAAATGSPSPLVGQWQRAEPGSSTFVDIAGATGGSYTTPVLKKATDDGAKYRVAYAVPGQSLLTAEAVLTVIIDSTPPFVTSAVAADNLKSVTLTFSEDLLAAGLNTAANYSVAGATVSSVTVLSPRSVRLVTSALTQGAAYTGTVSAVKDTAGNPVTADGGKFSFKAPVIVANAMKLEIFNGIGGVLPSDLKSNAKFPNSPDVVQLVPAYEASGLGDNYGARIKGFFTPATTGDYVAYFASDDGGELYLSTDDSEANKKLVAREPVWANGREWTGDSGGRRTDADKIDPAQPTANVSVPIRLVGGTRYYTEIIYKEGGGGDHGEAKFVLATDAAPENGSSPAVGSQISTAIDPDVLANLSLPLAERSDVGSGTTRGFRARVNQVNQIGNNGLPNFVFRAEQQLAGLIDTNSIDASAFGSDGFLAIDSVVNWNQEINAGGNGTEIGNFQSTSTPPNADVGIPGIPGLGKAGTASDNIAAEVLTYVEFPNAGVYFMGVNSDDGFAVYPTHTPPADNYGLYVTGSTGTKGYYAYYGGNDKGGIFRPITTPLEGKLVVADPIIADTALNNAAAIAGNIAVIDRGVVTFTTKVQNAKNAGAIGVVIVNSRDPDSADGKFPIGMGGSGADLPAMMIEKPHGAEIKATIAAGGTVTARIAPLTARILGQFDGGRGSSDTLFAFNVAQAGVYPLRLVWFEGGGGANVEWFTVNSATGDKVLLNDTANGGLKAWRARAFAPPVTPEVKATFDGTNIVLTYKGTLQSSDTIDGTYSDVAGNGTVTIPAGSSAGNKFYRARR